MGKTVQHVMVAGYGTMGQGIARSFAQSGLSTTVLSRRAGQLADLPDNINAVADLPETPPDLIIESVPEDIDLKIELLRRVDAAYGPDTIIGTNTSGLPITELAAPLVHRQRFLAIHYMHPADSMPMVEIARVAETTDDVVNRSRAALAKAGKDSVVLNEPVVGFLINRLQHALFHEAYHLIETGVVSVEDVDKVARRLLGPRMAVTGMLMQKDLSGLQTHARAHGTIVPYLCHKAEAHNVAAQKLRDNTLGIRTGTGFYDWRTVDIDRYKQAVAEKIGRLIAALDDRPIAIPPQMPLPPRESSEPD